MNKKLYLIIPIVLCVGYFFYKTSSAFFEFPFGKKPVRKPSNLQWMIVEDPEWNKMIDSITKLAKSYKGHVGIYLKDFSTEKTFEYKADKLFPSASLIKIPIMASIFQKINRGSFTLETQIKFSEKDRRWGSGSLKWARAGTKLSVSELLYKMITQSDNTAMQILVDYVGISALQDEFQNFGLVYTKINQEGLSLQSGRVAKENYTTAREMANLLERIYYRELVSESASEMMLDILKHSKSVTRLRKGIPISWEIGHKTGLLRRSCHDVGIIFAPRGDYLLAVLTGDVPSYSSAKELITKIGKITSKFYKLDNGNNTSNHSSKSNL